MFTGYTCTRVPANCGVKKTPDIVAKITGFRFGSGTGIVLVLLVLLLLVKTVWKFPALTTICQPLEKFAPQQTHLGRKHGRWEQFPGTPITGTSRTSSSRMRYVTVHTNVLEYSGIRVLIPK
eukprot:3449895-Rhodomonas_salina.1